MRLVPSCFFFFYHNGGDELTHSRISFSQLWLLSQRYGQHSSDVSLWAVHFHRQAKPLTSCVDLAQSVAEVWTTSSDPDFDTVLLELQYRILQNFDHSGKRGCNSAGCAKSTLHNSPVRIPSPSRNGVRVHNRFASTSDHRPYTTFVLQD